MKKILSVVVLLLVTGVNSLIGQDLVQYAVTTCGTSGKGFTFPGAAAPFGMIQWSPDTGPGIRKGGYAYGDTTVYGFSVDHMSGAGCTYAGNFMFTPVSGDLKINPPVDRTAFPSTFTHTDEVTKPSYYAMTINGNLRVELTTRTRSGFGRFTYPKGEKASMIINAASNVRGTIESSIDIDTLARAISGKTTGGHFCNGPDVTTVYFYTVFSHRFSGFGTWSDGKLQMGTVSGCGVNSGAFVTFYQSQGNVVLARTAISYVSVENAKENLMKEYPNQLFTINGFDKAKDENLKVWNNWFKKIEVKGGAFEDLKTFYSMMYHALLAPTVCSDVNGEYMGYDGKVHKTEKGRTHYANFSGWDIYRTECQFLGMIAPKEASDMAQALLVDYKQGGAFPRWGVPNDDAGIMVGDPSAPVIAGFYNFGAKNFDAKETLKGLLRAASDTTVKITRSGLLERIDLGEYLKLGYISQSGKNGSVSRTLEYASADFALSQFAFALGDKVNGAKLQKQAQSWRNLFNPETGYIQMKRRDGSWAPGFVVNKDKYDSTRAYVEGTAGQYVWMVPFNLKELAEKMGGNDAAAKRLDGFFTKLNGGFSSEFAYIGNEPSIGTPWIYDFIGRPYKTQEISRRVVNELFSSEPLGCPGNDDLGTLGSWYIWATLGMYPELPGSDVLVLGSPLFEKAIVHLKGGDVVITGKGAAKNSPYVQSLKFNGKSWNKPWIRYSDISKGASMVYELNSTPDTKWGSDPKDAPPSYQ